MTFNEYTLNQSSSGPEWLFDLDAFVNSFNIFSQEQFADTSTDSVKVHEEEDFRIDFVNSNAESSSVIEEESANSMDSSEMRQEETTPESK